MQQSANPVKRFFSWLNAEDVDEDGEQMEQLSASPAPDVTSRRQQQQQQQQPPSQRGPLHLRGTNDGGMEIRHPRGLEERMTVGLDLKQRRMVTLDLTRLPDAEARYFLEFMYGVIFALDATAEKVTDGIYLLAPRGVNVRNDADGEPGIATSTAAPTDRRSGRDGQEELFWQAR